MRIRIEVAVDVDPMEYGQWLREQGRQAEVRYPADAERIAREDIPEQVEDALRRDLSLVPGLSLGWANAKPVA